MKRPSILLLLFLTGTYLLSGCAKHYVPTDKHATRETRALYKNLASLSKNHTLFGHQHASEYGMAGLGRRVVQM